jgi:hypothetical protein
MPSASYSDNWEEHKEDFQVWRKFWALWELRRKWNWADWFYNKLDRIKGNVLESKAWSLFPGEGYMKLCLWIALLRSVQEGIIENLDSNETPKNEKIAVKIVFPVVPDFIASFPAIKGSPFRDFRNAIFHCQWAPTLAKFDLDEITTKQIEKLHKEIGNWLNSEFRTSFKEFEKKYSPPPNWVFQSDGSEFMPELFY